MHIKEWFTLQLNLQREAFNLDPSLLEGEALGEFITWNALALEDELHELLQEVQWKPWAKDRGRIIDRGQALKEYVDMMHFMGNLALAFRFEPSDVEDAYLEKLQINALRQLEEGGYDAVGSKCPRCHRNLADAGVTVTTTELAEGLTIRVTRCNGCDEVVDRLEAQSAEADAE